MADGEQSADVRSGASSPVRCSSLLTFHFRGRSSEQRVPKRRAVQAKGDVKAAVLCFHVKILQV